MTTPQHDPGADTGLPATHHLMIMAYGGPDSLDDVRPYLLDVRNYRETSEHVFAEITDRYRQIGGRSPILELTQAEAKGIEDTLNELAAPGERWKVWVGMRHWRPFIKDTLAAMEADGVSRTMGLVMAPHYSRMSIGAYFKRAAEAGSPVEIVPVEDWHLLPAYLDALAERVNAALETFPEDVRADVPVIFSAHSLPERILEWNDPYPTVLRETVDALTERLPGRAWKWAYQSAAMTPDPWLGPDAGDVITELAGDGHKHILICPIGFICEHVEILYDIDIEYQQLAGDLGVQLERIEMLNAHPGMLAGLAGLVRGKAVEAGLVADSVEAAAS
ncbi:MAG: ferrochelatase [Thermomicrobiales bacterium]